MTDSKPQARPSPPPVLVVGVKAGQPDAVVEGAVRFARQMGAGLVLASVDDTRYTVRYDPEGMVAAYSIDSDDPAVVHERVDFRLRDHLGAVLATSGVEWNLRELAGEPAHELARLAREHDALAIVVGTRRRGLRGSAAEFFSGSVAVHLAHRQHRPVIVIPLQPVAVDEPAPWEGGSPSV